jgi:hypothetical protein
MRSNIRGSGKYSAGLTPKQVDHLVDEYQAGHRMLKLAKRWRLHRTVAEHLHRAGVAVRQRSIPCSQLGEAIRLYREGCSCQRLAGRFGCDAETGAAGAQVRGCVAAQAVGTVLGGGQHSLPLTQATRLRKRGECCCYYCEGSADGGGRPASCHCRIKRVAT